MTFSRHSDGDCDDDNDMAGGKFVMAPPGSAMLCNALQCFAMLCNILQYFAPGSAMLCETLLIVDSA